jgi:plastocyanin
VVDIPAKPTDCAPIGLAAVIKNGCVGSATWKTPKSLSPGTYTYFCRVHPFMRGAFRVVPGKKS